MAQRHMAKENQSNSLRKELSNDIWFAYIVLTPVSGPFTIDLTFYFILLQFSFECRYLEVSQIFSFKSFYFHFRKTVIIGR